MRMVISTTRSHMTALLTRVALLSMLSRDGLERCTFVKSMSSWDCVRSLTCPTNLDETKATIYSVRTMILVFIHDLIFQTKIRSTAEALGAPVWFARRLDDWKKQIADEMPPLLIVDLNAGEDALAAVAVAAVQKETGGNRAGGRIIAFVSHVDVGLAERAWAAGADEVMPRSKFSAELPTILSECGGVSFDPRIS